MNIVNIIPIVGLLLGIFFLLIGVNWRLIEILREIKALRDTEAEAEAREQKPKT